MSKTYAIVDNGIVVNVIIADDDFISHFHPDSVHPYEEVHEDDTLVARIGDSFVDGKFITPQPEPVQVTSITKLQAMQQFEVMDLWDTMKVFLSSNIGANDWWTNSSNLSINNAKVLEYFPQIVTTVTLQEFFNEANLFN